MRAMPQPKRRGLRDVFQWGCSQWNIEILEEQLEVLRGEDD